MSFIYPESFVYLAVLPLLGLLFWYAYLRGKKDLLQLIGKWRSGKYLELYYFKKTARALFFLLALLTLVFAMADHPWGGRAVEEDRSGLEIALLLDISRSMMVKDMDGSRLKRAADLIRGILGQRDDTQFSLTLFKGGSSTVIPFTEDRLVFENLLTQLSPNLLTHKGTNLEKGLKGAVESFPPGRETYKMIILFSDGEELSGRMSQLSNQIKEMGIRLLVVGLGKEEGGPLVSFDGTYLLDEEGRQIISKLYSRGLKTLAADTRGFYFSGADPLVLGKIRKEINSIGDFQESKGVRMEEGSSYPFYISLSVLFLILYILTGAIRWKKVF